MIAIRFAEWILQSGYHPWVMLDNTRVWIYKEAPSDFLTTMQLYSLFLETESHELVEENSGN